VSVCVCVCCGASGEVGGKGGIRTRQELRHTAAFSLAVVLADARPSSALLALASSAVVFEIVDPPHRLQVLLSRLCS
jgi:hypothetical protein